MKVNFRMGKPDVYVGDIVIFNKIPCMVIDMGHDTDSYGLLSLDEVSGGEVIETFETLSTIDRDSRTERVIMKKADVLIYKKGGAEDCLF